MKKSKLLLVFALLVCSVGQAFGQETSFDRERRFQATIVKDIMMCPSVDMVDAYVNLICLDFCYDKFGMEKTVRTRIIGRERQTKCLNRSRKN